ncbi:MAG: hypothetical protein HZA50_11510 [Planctomycetes bacterium]|nr:hypothetical protein [Planctomycetota bacterium]
MKTAIRQSRNSGTALILIVGLLTILAILGTTMLTMARIDRKANMSSDTSAGAQIVARGILRQAIQHIADDAHIAAITSASATYAPYGDLWNQSTSVDKWKKFIDYSSEDVDKWLGDHPTMITNLYPLSGEKMYPLDGLSWSPSTRGAPPIHPTNLIDKTLTAAQAAYLTTKSFQLTDVDGYGETDSSSNPREGKAFLFDTNVLNDQGDRYFAAAMVYDLSAVCNINVGFQGIGYHSFDNSATYTSSVSTVPPISPQFVQPFISYTPNAYYRALKNTGAAISGTDYRDLYYNVSLRYFTPKSATPTYSPIACDDNLKMNYSTGFNFMGRFYGYGTNVTNTSYLGTAQYKMCTAHNCTRSLMRYPAVINGYRTLPGVAAAPTWSSASANTMLYRMPLDGLSASGSDVTSVFVPDPTNMGSEVQYGSWDAFLNQLYYQMKYFFNELGIQDAQKRAAYFCANYRLYRHRTQTSGTSTVNATWYENPYIAAGGWNTWTSPDGDAVYVVWEQPYISQAYAGSLPQWPSARAGAWCYAIEVYNPYYKVSATDNRFTFDIFKGAANLGTFTIGATPLAAASDRKVYYDLGGYIDDIGAGTLAGTADFNLPAGAVQVPGLAFDSNTLIRLVRNGGAAVQLDSVKISEFAAAPNNAGLAPGTGGTGYALEGLRDDTSGVSAADRRRVCLPVYAWRTATDGVIGQMKNLLKVHNLGYQSVVSPAANNSLTADELKQITVGDSSKAIHNFQTNTASTAGDRQENHSAAWGMPVIMGTQPWAFTTSQNSGLLKSRMPYGSIGELNHIRVLGPTTDQDVPHRVRDEFPDIPGRGMLDPAPPKRMNINYDTGALNGSGDRVYAAQTGQNGWTSSLDATHVYPDVPAGALLAEFFEYVPTDKWRGDGENFRNYGKVNVNTMGYDMLRSLPWEITCNVKFDPWVCAPFYDRGPATGFNYNRFYMQVGATQQFVYQKGYLPFVIAYREKRAPKDYMKRWQLRPESPGLDTFYQPDINSHYNWWFFNMTQWSGWHLPEVYPRNYAASRSSLASGGSDIQYLRDASNFQGFVTPGEIAVPLADYVMSLFTASYTSPGPGVSYNAACTRHCEPYNYNDNGWRNYVAPVAAPPLMDASTDVVPDVANIAAGNVMGNGNDPKVGGPHPRAKLTPYYATFAYAETDLADAIKDGIGYRTDDSNYQDFYTARNIFYNAVINLLTVNSDTYGITVGVYRGPNMYATAANKDATQDFSTITFTNLPGPAAQPNGYQTTFAHAAITAPTPTNNEHASVVMSGPNAGFTVKGAMYNGGVLMSTRNAWGSGSASNYPSCTQRDYYYYFSSSNDSQRAGINGSMNLTKDSVNGTQVSLGLTDYTQWDVRVKFPGYNTGIKEQMTQLTTDSWVYVGVIDRSNCKVPGDMPAVLSFGQVK